MLNKKISIIIILIFTITIVILSFALISKPRNDFSPSVLVVYKSGTNNYLDIYQNFKQSYILNTEVTALNQKEFINTSIKNFDLIYPDSSLIRCSNVDNISNKLTSYVQQGGNLFLEYEWHNTFSKNFTGVHSFKPHSNNKYKFTYPKVDYNLEQLQLVAKNFLNNFIDYRKKDFNFLNFNKGTLTNNSQSIINIKDKSIMALNKYKKGYVLMCSNLIPNDSLITGFDLKSKNENQTYFDFSLATINYFIRNEFLAFSMKEKHGFVFKKIFGPYGRPAMTWQNHYEALSSIKNKEMISWIDLLKKYNQIPSISLIRSPFEWGTWKSSITFHPNVGTTNNPSFVGEYKNSFYSSGKKLTTNNDYLTFGKHPEYKSLKSKITMPHRAYPAIVDFDNDGDNDLIIGAPNGKLYFVKNSGTSSKPNLNSKKLLKLQNDNACSVGSFASPCAYDINKDGLFDLVVGNKQGEIHVFKNNGSSSNPEFTKSYKLSIKVSGCSTPSIDDIDNDKIDELVVGSSSGAVMMYEKNNNRFKFVKKIITDDKKYCAPTIYDWNNDGKKDILLGDNSGTIKLFINNNEKFIFKKYIKGQTYNMYGNKNLLGGHNSVPLVTDWNGDKKQDLVVGQLEFGIPYNIDGKFFKHKKELKDIINHASKHGIPIYPHFYTHKHKNPAQEADELKLHKKAFKEYNLDWNTGTDQHTWQTNEHNPQQTLKSAMKSGLWWNFGFNPPNQPDLPRDGKEFLWSTPFLLSNKEKTNKFLAFTPSPNLFKYPKAYNSFSNLDMPITYFEHIEYRFSNQDKLNHLKQIANFLNEIRKKGEYNFITQEQMAKSFMNTFYSKAYVHIKDNEILMIPDTSRVPALAGKYKNTLGIKLEKGEMYKNSNFSTSSSIYYQKDNSLYYGLNNKTKILSKKFSKNKFHIIRSNVPIKTTRISNKINIKFLNKGMQQIKIYSPHKLDIEGKNIKIKQNNKFYTITHYGNPITINITKKQTT